MLDALLADPRIGIEGLSGTSAGALNATVLASSYARAADAGQDPRAAARAALARLWEKVAVWDGPGAWQRRRHPAAAPPGPARRGFRPRLAQLLRRRG